MTTTQVMHKLNISRSLLNRLVASGQLRGEMRGNKWHFEEKDVRACIVEQTPVPPRHWGGYKQARQ